MAAGAGHQVVRPFHLRWGLPALCGANLRAWWAVWITSWIVLGVSTVGWAFARGLTPAQACLTGVLLLGLPGILGPGVSIPVQVDLPATALTMLGVALAVTGHPIWIVVGIMVIMVASSVRETAPICAALWLWSPWPLIALVVPLIIAIVRKPAASSGIPEWDRITAHPFRTSLEYHAGRWRDARLMILPWGVCLVGLYALDWRLAIILGIAYAQLLIATDTVRLYQHVAGPALAITAAALIPDAWVPLAMIGHLFWIWKPERI
jgi:hypothetical protein